MSDILYIGIDPGKSGGIAWIWKGHIHACVMPDTEFGIMKKVARSLPKISSMSHCFIEKVHAMPAIGKGGKPNQGIKSTFTFGMGYGGLRMALLAGNIPFEEVNPYTWQKALGIPKKKPTESKTVFKNRLLAQAQQMYPKFGLWSKPRTKGKQLAVADAILIATYCQRKIEGLL